MILKTFRRRLAMLIAGEQAMLVLPDKEAPHMRANNWQGLSDESLAMVMRHGAWAIADMLRTRAEEKHLPLNVMITTDAAMSLIRHAREVNADTMVIHQSGTIAGEDVGVWKIELSQLPNGYDFGEPGIKEEVYDEGGKLVRLAYGINVA